MNLVIFLIIYNYTLDFIFIQFIIDFITNLGVDDEMKVSVIGATGYGGEELMRLLSRHPSVSVHSIHATSLHGEPLTKVYPHMQQLIDHKLEPVDVDKIASEVDLVFLATPTGVAMKLAPAFLEKGVKVIDLSGDYRIQNKKAFETWYQTEAADDQYVEEAVYGLTEWVDEDITKAQLVSNPGCYPTAALLGLAPIVKEKLIDPTTIIIDAKTGVSGAGKGLSQATHFSETNDNLKIYKVNQHQHTPEIEEKLHKWNSNVGAVTFTTHLVPMTRGIMCTTYGTATEATSTEALVNLYKEKYKNNYFVRVRDAGTFPATKEVSGSNFCDIGITYDERTKRITVVSVIDNLVKGASGQAIQNMNQLLGLDEKTGLDLMPNFP